MLGGFLTEFLDWRWCLLVDLFFVAIGLIGGALFLTESKAGGDNRYDLWGARLVTSGRGVLVYGFSLAETGWGTRSPSRSSAWALCCSPRPMLIGGPLVVAVALIYLSFITPDGNYFVQVAPALLVMGMGMAFVFIPRQNVALTGVAPHDAGVASAVTNSAMQIGRSIGLSVFTAVYASVVGGHSADSHDALDDGYSGVIIAAAVGMVVASVIAITLVRGRKEDLLPQGAVESDGVPVLVH